MTIRASLSHLSGLMAVGVLFFAVGGAAQTSLTIPSSTNNYNVATAAGNPGAAQNITVTIPSGVVVGSANTGCPRSRPEACQPVRR